MSDAIVEVHHLVKHFAIAKGISEFIWGPAERYVHALDDISFRIRNREVFSLVGETGSGKTTAARLILKLMKPTSGKIFFDGKDIWNMSGHEEKIFRKDLQMIFQDPYASLNPRKRIYDIVSTSMRAQRWGTESERREIVSQVLEKVGLSPPEEVMDRYPHEFSGGQRQRIGIARALALKPKFVVADEPVSSLDVSIQAQILNLMINVKREFGITCLLISHDLAVVRHMSDTVGMLYAGMMCELAACRDLFEAPLHPYTRALIASVPVPDPDFEREEVKIGGEVPSPINIPQGCRFWPRCPSAKERCRLEIPKMIEAKKEHFVACHLG